MPPSLEAMIRSPLRGEVGVGLIIIVMTYDTFEAGEIDSVGRAYYNGR